MNSNKKLLLTFIVAFISQFFLLSAQVTAHTFKPSKVDVAFISKTQYTIKIETDLIEIAKNYFQLTGSDYELVGQVRKMSKIQLYKMLTAQAKTFKKKITLSFDDQTTTINELFAPKVFKVVQLLSFDPALTDYRVTFSGYGTKKETSKQVQFYFPESLGAVKLQLSEPELAIVSSGVQTDKFTLNQSQTVDEFAVKVAQSLHYVYQGIIHIIPRGFDHILFVLALFLLSPKLSTLLWQISAFTLAHTISLALAMFGYVSISPAIVEPLIALSIAYVAVENIVHQRLSRWRVVIVFMFGLLHGLGFASVLMEVGLPQSAWILSLLSFNVGVEIGQLLLVLSAFILIGWAQHYTNSYRKRVIIPLSLLIALMGVYWFIERIFFS